jgi:hypothetical protein
MKLWAVIFLNCLWAITYISKRPHDCKSLVNQVRLVNPHESAKCIMRRGIKDEILCFSENFKKLYWQVACEYSSQPCAAFSWFGLDHPNFPYSCFLFSSCARAR